MSKFVLAAALGIALFGTIPTHADASANGCLHSNNQAAGCTSSVISNTAIVPEPGTLMLAASGLLGLAGFALLRRKGIV